MKKILIPYDGSDYAFKAVNYALEMVKAHSGIKVTIITVGAIPDFSFYKEYTPDRSRILEAYKKGAETRIKKAVEVFEKEGISVETILATGDPAESIIETVKTQGFDKVIMGTRGLSGVKGMFLGSVSAKIIAMVNVPITLVK